MGVKKKAAALVSVPRSYKAADALLRRHGEIGIQLVKAEADLAGKIALITARVAAEVAPLMGQLRQIEERLKAYADANRAALTDENKVKFHDMPAGRIGWRSKPTAVTWKKGLKAEDIVENVKVHVAQMRATAQHLSDSDGATEAAIERIGIVGTFIRTKEEPNKEAMLENSELALLIDGVKIGSAGEAFYVEPVGAVLSEGAP